LVDGLDHVDRDADGPSLVGDGPAHRLADPPGGVRRELVAALVLELLDRAHEPDVPLLDEIEEPETAVRVALGDRHAEAEVGLDEPLLPVVVLLLPRPDGVERRAELLGRHVDLAQDLLRLPAGLADNLAAVDDLGRGRSEEPARGAGGIALARP